MSEQVRSCFNMQSVLLLRTQQHRNFCIVCKLFCRCFKFVNRYPQFRQPCSAFTTTFWSAAAEASAEQKNWSVHLSQQLPLRPDKGLHLSLMVTVPLYGNICIAVHSSFCTAVSGDGTAPLRAMLPPLLSMAAPSAEIVSWKG